MNTSVIVKIQVRVFVERDTVGYHAYCPALPGLHVDGDTIDEAFSVAEEAVRAHTLSLVKHGDPLPVGFTVYNGIWDLIVQEIKARFPKREGRLITTDVPCPA